ncbi:Copper-transporting ATPase [Melia azedarach]|uniref:Copper-transporting ATPase n=2 Tax=Melia azedarach TaxID=155640 RepID=A0ACC1Y0I1_MELAZ|nr:Copper-transporting ATPase [Melia azedarach]
MIYLGDTNKFCRGRFGIRNLGTDNFFKVFEKKMLEKRNRLKESGRELAVSWALCAVCLVGHLSHILGAKASWIHAFHSTGFHLSLSLFTLLGPGRQLILDGVKSLFRGAPNMNTLVGLGALSSFTVSSFAAFMPKLGWKAFFEEPIMLIAFVLLGRNLEQRAKIKATSDMTGLLSVLPSKARLLVDSDTKDSGSIVEVPCNSLHVGDHIVVLPGDRVPADGIVRAGRSVIDESSFTGEPLPVTKLPGSQVAAGSINLNGTLTVEVERPGGETAMADIVRLVEEAQSREAPVQRLADKVSGHFTYGVMALSAATFMFWNLFGVRILPAAIHHGSPVSLALQLSCSVLVIACPCALGLATPTAMLVGTSLGATRGLLLRGGNILEKFSMVNTVVFDKTGTLTIGRPVVTKVVTSGDLINPDSKQNPFHSWSEIEILELAAGVESNTVHPIGKAIVEAAQVANCQIAKVVNGTFIEEPGSGAVAVIDDRTVSVGTIDWVHRHGVDASAFQEVDIEELKNQSVVYVGVDNVLAGLIYVEDQIREDAVDVVRSLSSQGIGVYMLSGDKRNTAEYVASLVGIPKEQVLSGVKPDEKKRFINELQKDQNIVAMVGDGINDAAALASSHVGVAMGGGVGAASEVSSVVLMGNRLSQLLDALELSRLTMKTVKQNLWWAFAYNIVGIPIAAGMLLPITGTMLTPSIAGALMGLSSIGVMANSLLLRLKFSSKHKLSFEASHSSQLMLKEQEKKNHPYSYPYPSSSSSSGR